MCQTLSKEPLSAAGSPGRGKRACLLLAPWHLWAVQAPSPPRRHAHRPCKGAHQEGLRLETVSGRTAPKIFYDGRNVLDLHCPLATWLLTGEMWLVHLWG